MWTRIANVRELARHAGGADAPGPDLAALVERTDACIFASVSAGLAGAGENRRAIARTIDARRQAHASVTRN